MIFFITYNSWILLLILQVYLSSLLQALSLEVLYEHFYIIGFNKESVKIVNVISIGLKTKFWTPSVILIVLMYKLYVGYTSCVNCRSIFVSLQLLCFFCSSEYSMDVTEIDKKYMTHSGVMEVTKPYRTLTDESYFKWDCSARGQFSRRAVICVI